KQVPPRYALSTIAVFIPSCAARIAATYPPGPAPITIRSKFDSATVIDPFSSRCLRLRNYREADPKTETATERRIRHSVAVGTASAARLHFEHQPCRVFQRLLDSHQEADRFLPVDHAMVVAQRQVHHRPNLNLVADRHRPLLDR